MKFTQSISLSSKIGALLGSVLLICGTSVAADSNLAELQKNDTLSDSQLNDFHADGRWLGPGWWANRLQDWQRTGSEGEAIQCKPAKAFMGWRVAHDMVRPLDLEKGELDLSVQVGMHSSKEAQPLAPDSLAGVLIGVGHTLDDPMARAMLFEFKKGKKAQTAYAAVPGTGIAVGVSGDGHLRIIDLDTGKLCAEAPLKQQPGTDIQVSTKTKGPSVELTLSGKTESGSASVSASFPKQRFQGGVALVSHPGSKSKKHGSLESSFLNYRLKSGFRADNQQAIGPIVNTQYTVDRGVLKLTAQCTPQQKGTTATLSIYRDGAWKKAATAKIHPIDQLALFRVENWDSHKAQPYQVSIPLAGSDKPVTYTGLITAEPTNGNVRVATLGGILHRPWGAAKDWNKVLYFPHHDIQKRAMAKKPDIVFFYGDQIYEGTPSGIDRQNYFEDYLYKWLFHCMSFREMTRNLPSVTLPDDHDVYQGNYWGEGGRKAPNNDWNYGGYMHPGEFVAQVHRTQTGNLPDAFEPDCLKQNIPAYHCDWNWGGLSIAIICDRYFKSGPAGHGLPKSGTNRPDHYNNPDFDTKDLDLPGLQLLGEPQERFLGEWAADWSQGAQLKLVLSQSPPANLATHHHGTYLIADLDSNGWPQSGRKRFLSLMRSARSVHIGGDQHLATMVQHGIDHHGDAIYGFAAPSVANAYARAYFPGNLGNYYKVDPPEPEDYLGERLDGFKNKVTFHAVANPDNRESGPYHTAKLSQMNHQVPGFGITDFDTKGQTITFDCLPRSEEVASRLKGGSYPGWPLKVNASQNDGRKPIGELANITIEGEEAPVVRVYGPDGKMEWAQRMASTTFTVPAYTQGKHRVEIGDGNGKWHTLTAQPQTKAKEVKIKLP